ncbi:metallophosphoesterase [soil metagenome]
MKLSWLTDLHLDRIGARRRITFFNRLRGQEADVFVITGDISRADRLPFDLRGLARACAPRPIFFTLGNHDFHGGSFGAVDQAVAEVCKLERNLVHLGHGEAIPLTETAVLIGYRGWYDGRAGYGHRSNLHNSDHRRIEDLRRLSEKATFAKMEELGRASARYLRNVLPYALTCYRQVWIATHVPPFIQAATFSGRPCGPRHLPHFTNISAGGAIQGIAQKFPNRGVTVLCGHTHDRSAIHVRPNIQVYTGASKRGDPQIQWLFDVAST